MPQVRDYETERQSLTAKYRDWDAYDTGDDSSSDAPEPFKDIIQRDPCVCDHCFTRRYDEEAHEWSQGELGWMEFNNWVAVPERSEPIPADEGSGTRLTCAECGHKSTKHRPLSKDDVADFTKNLITTLDEKGIEFDADVLRHEVTRRNVSKNQCRQDSHVFTPAVRYAIAAATQDHPTVDSTTRNGLSAD